MVSEETIKVGLKRLQGGLMDLKSLFMDFNSGQILILQKKDKTCLL
jgi:hypothetical protein